MERITPEQHAEYRRKCREYQRYTPTEPDYFEEQTTIEEPEPMIVHYTGPVFDLKDVR